MANFPPGYGSWNFPPPSAEFLRRMQNPPDNPMEFIEFLKKEGNSVISSNPSTAVELYSKCVEVDDLFRVLVDRERAIIHSNRSQAYMKLGDLGGAFHDAIDCVKIDPSYVKGYWRAAMVMKRLDRYSEALEALIDGLDKVRGNDPKQVNTRIDFVYEITGLSSNLDGKWKKAEYLFRSIKVDAKVWTEVVKKLAEKKDYKAMHLALLGGGGHWDKGKGGLATGCSTAAIDIKTIVRELNLMQLKTWGIKLIHQLIVFGADFNGLSLKDSDTPLHCALMLALTNGWFVLFDYLLREKYTKPQSRNLLDRSGSSLYHMVAKSTDGRHELRALQSLKNYQVSPFLLDRQSRTPLHYATDENIKAGIKEAINFCNKPTHNRSSQTSASAQPQLIQRQSQPGAQRPPMQQQNQAGFAPSTHQQQQWQSGGEPARPKTKPPQQQFRWEAETQQAHGYNAYSGQPYWEAQQQKQRFGSGAQHPWHEDPDTFEMERQRKMQEKRRKVEEDRRRQKEQENAERRKRQEEERRQQKVIEMMMARKRAEEEQRRIAAEEKRKKEEKRQKQKEQRIRRQQDLKQQSLYQQGLHYAGKNQHIQAVTYFAKFISENHANQFQLNDVERCRKAFAKSLVQLEEIPADLECDDSPHCWQETVEKLASEEQWKAVALLLKKDSFAHGCNCINISIASFMKTWNKSMKLNKQKFIQTLLEVGNCINICVASFLKTWNKSMKLNKQKFIQVLLEHQARPNGLLKEDETPVLLCVKNHNYDIESLMLLLGHGAYPSQLSLNTGDTALHAALRIGFAVSDRKFKVLNVLLEKFSDPSGASYLDSSAVDKDGNGLFHIAIKEGTKNLSLEAVKLLSKHKVNPQLPNKKGEIPLQMVKRNDRRYPFLTQAATHHPKLVVPKASAKGDESSASAPQLQLPSAGHGDASQSRSVTDDGIRVGDSTSVKHAGMIPTKITWRDEMKRDITILIDVLPPYVAKRAHFEEVATAPRVEEMMERLPDRRKVEQEQESKGKVLGDVSMDDDVNEEGDVEEDLEEEDISVDVEDTSIFDNLTWEVECTAKAWKILRDRHVQHKLKQGIIRKIQLLGNGDWRKRLCKEVEGTPQQRGMKLYEAKLTKGGRILWELAIAFSPRCSEESEKRLEGGSESTSGSSTFAVAGGRIYSEIIRIWDIVFDHDNLNRTIETVVKSYERGRECIIQKKLVGIDKKEFTSGKTTQQRVPMFYRETGDNSPQRSPTKNNNNQQLVDKAKNFFPPASSKENEYHIMKFYSFNSSLVNAILTDSSVKVDFPFRVTELEHAIINLQPRPPSSVLLLGRSGTGKTTCCLYRLWTAFVRYWKLACDTGGEPLIPREVAFIHKDALEEEEEDEEEDEEENDDDETETLSDASYENSASSSSALAAASQSSAFNIPNLEEDEDDDSDKIVDHLHQIFITKNGVLCSEVQRNFRDLSHACEFAQEHRTVEDNPVPMRLQDAHPAVFPLFLNSRQFLLMLDGSLPGPYFPRNDDGSLKRKIQGWGKEEGPMDFIPVLEDEDEESDAEHSDEDVNNETNEGTDGMIGGDGEQEMQRKNVKYDPRREVTYEVFAYELWQRINKKAKLPYHPTLVWMEITSFIKGSVEALHTEKGHLAENKYQELGCKRAPNFTADRGKIYKVYLAYEHEKRQRQLFDEADLVFHIYRRMRDIQQPDWAVHQFYVDETQDFTQAELSLIIRCCHDPNALFLTGDTAQSIMRGVAFRFDDLKSLFYYASKSVKSLGKHSKARVPKRVYQLTHNYRSHAGILNLASSVVDLMFHFFPNSFDRLDRDQGLFDGPSPVLLESCSFSDLALLLRGNKRKTSEIEFGAHQVILVANEEAKDKLPAELSLGLVLTIFEAKGLEFDDVLLYNVFRDSPADKEWRVVTEYLDELIEEYEQQKKTNDRDAAVVLHSIDIENMQAANRPRPLKFDPDKHKVLNSELKYLYTAITRARVNVWMFDEDETKRAPMFEYFRRLRLVKVVKPDAVDKGGNSELDSMFVETSSQEEWDKRGDYFYEHKLWLVAAKCYRRAGQEKKELKAEAHHRALEAERLHDQPSRMREEFLAAALAFLQAGDLGSLAARCLFNAKEYMLSAQLFEKMGQMSQAAKIYENRAKRLTDASRCYEQCGDYAKAIELLALIGMHIKAADVVERFHQMKKEYGNARLPSRNKPPRASDTVESLCFQAANYYHKQRNMDKMMDALKQLPKFEERINFLKNKGLYHKAVDILKDEGRYLEAAKILRSQGKLEDACHLLDWTEHQQFVAECQLGRARKLVQGTLEGDDVKMVEGMLTTAIELFGETKDLSRQAESHWLLGVLKKDAEIVKEAKREFGKAANSVGEIHAADSLLSGLALPKYNKMRAAFYPLNLLFQVINAVAKPKKREEQRHAALCDEFYGIQRAREGSKVTFNKHEGARVKRLLTEVVPDEADLQTMRQKIIVNDLIPMAIRWVECLRKVSRDESTKLEKCQKYVIGMECGNSESCPYRHEFYPQGILHEYINNVISLLILDDIINDARKLSNMSAYSQELSKVFDEEEQASNCAYLYNILFPRHCHPRQISESGKGGATRHFFDIIHHNKPVEKRMKWYVKWRHEESESFSRKGDRDVDRRANTDVWLQVWNVHRLFDNNTKEMEEWVAKEEKYCNSTWKASKPPLGMMSMPGATKTAGLTGIPRFDKGKQSQRYMSYMQQYFESFSKLYSSQRVDPIGAVLSFHRFLGFIATHAVEPIIPSIRNIVSLMEFWLTVSLAIISKVDRKAVVIPASYLAQLNFYDALCSRKFKAPAVYNTISQHVTASHATLEKTIFPKLEYMVDLVCAIGKFTRFNILGDAFSDEVCVKSGEAERSLVFALVILCNVGVAFTEDDGTCIRRLFHTIPLGNYPPRLTKALESVKAAMSHRDTLITLQTLLQEREDERCYQCEWKDYVHFLGGAPGLIYSKLNPGGFVDVKYHVVEEVATRQNEEERAEAKEADQDDAEISPEEAERWRQTHEKLEEQERKASAANKIQGWARQILKKLKLLRAARVFALRAYSRQMDFTIVISKEEEQTPSQADQILGTPEHWVNNITLLPYYIDESVCTICNNVTLQGKAQKETYHYEPAPVDADLDAATTGEPVSPVVERPPTPPLPAPIESAPSKEEHEKSGEHQDRLKHFNNYRQYLMYKVYPVIRDRSILMKKFQRAALHYKSSFASGSLLKDEVNKHGIDLFGERLKDCGFKLHSVMEEIHKRQAWEQIPELDGPNGPVQELHLAVESAKKVIAELETSAQDSQDGNTSAPSAHRQASDEQATAKDRGAFEGDDEYDDHLLTITQEPEKGFQQPRQRRKQKSKWTGQRKPRGR